MPTRAYDVIIVGSGAAALYTAYHIDSRLKVAVLNKDGLKNSSSYYAQGGIAAVTQKYDSTELHFQDTITAGAGLCDEAAVRVLVRQGGAEIERLIKYGVPFDRDKKGNLVVTREGAHSVNRILHCSGDATGKHLTSSLIRIVTPKDNITIFNGYFLADIVTDAEGRTAGVTVYNPHNEIIFLSASKVVIATGGVGKLFRNSTNPKCITGDGIATALRAGVHINNMEFTQFHPTALAHIDRDGRLFLISEAVRGEGGVLRNRKGERFMEGQHPLADLAPRDIVARAIVFQMQTYDLPNVYLDITTKSRDFLKQRFPTIYEECMSRNIDIALNWIPVFPAEHYFMGGIVTDTKGKTSMDGLYACGECACTGVHGANRLASNSLLECLVFGRRIAEDINGSEFNQTTPEYSPSPVLRRLPVDTELMCTRIREIMTKKCGIIRNGQAMNEALTETGSMFDILDNIQLSSKKLVETYNMALVSREMLRAALARHENVGAHYRSDNGKGEE